MRVQVGRPGGESTEFTQKRKPGTFQSRYSMTLPLSVRFFRLIQKLTGSDYSGPDNLTQPLVPDKTALSTKYTAIPTTNGIPNGRLRERNLGVRLELRKRLMRRRRWLVNLEFAMAVTGILLMIVENELYYANPEEKTTPAGIALRMFDGRVDDPFAVTPLSTWLSLAAELIICSIHPFPGNITATFLVVSGDSAVGSIDGVLSVLMMMRLYLVGKFIVVHSSLLTGQSTQTISAVSHVKININFVLRVHCRSNGLDGLMLNCSSGSGHRSRLEQTRSERYVYNFLTRVTRAQQVQGRGCGRSQVHHKDLHEQTGGTGARDRNGKNGDALEAALRDQNHARGESHVGGNRRSHSGAAGGVHAYITAGEKASSYPRNAK
ncbi:hypothetical protein C0Q70_19281 [Pomacea canaliculata]|uniref:Uncharacterized protein n=1 Tax=Pomacea canaliculata TaxID=400727 RepID=A0A2T7NIY6_POMCA|nr:hypothetical protein C0Q70_19281 [Pomacea canaliculata]